MSDFFKQRMHLYLIQSIYDALINPEGWGEVIAEIRKETGATSAALIGFSTSGEHRASVLTDCMPREAITAADFVEAMRALTATLAPGCVMTLDVRRDTLLPLQTLCDTFGQEGKLTIAIAAKEHRRRFNLILFFNRHDRYDATAVNDVIMGVLPHLQTAMGVYRQMLNDRERTDRLGRLFSSSVTPRLVVCEDMRIIEGNRAFSRLTEQRDSPLGVCEGYLNIRWPLFRSEVEKLVERCGANRSAVNVTWLKAAEASAGWLLKADCVVPETLTNLPFANLHTSREAKFMLSFYKVGEHNGLTPAVISSVLGLTASEAALACELAHGNAPSEIAQLRGVAKNTVHNQLTSIMARHGFHRQGQLLTLLSTLALFIG